jgi:hypothetical protein
MNNSTRRAGDNCARKESVDRIHGRREEIGGHRVVEGGEKRQVDGKAGGKRSEHRNPHAPIDAAVFPDAVQLRQPEGEKHKDRGKMREDRRGKAQSEHREPKTPVTPLDCILPCDKRESTEAKEYAIRSRFVSIILGPRD